MIPSFKGTYQSVERLEVETLWLAQGSHVKIRPINLGC